MVTKVSAAVIDGITASGSTEPRTLADRFADVVNVKDFGAVGDGVTDDSEAIQSAIDYAESTSTRFLFFPRGVYLIGSTLTIKGNNWTVLGAGKSCTTLLAGSDADILSIDCRTETYRYGMISGLNFKKESAPYGNTAAIHVRGEPTSAGGLRHWTFRDLMFMGVEYGVFFDDAGDYISSEGTSLSGGHGFNNFVDLEVPVMVGSRYPYATIRWEGVMGPHNRITGGQYRSRYASVMTGGGGQYQILGDFLMSGVHCVLGDYAIELLGPTDPGAYRFNHSIIGCQFDVLNEGTVKASNIGMLRVIGCNSIGAGGLGPVLSNCIHYVVEANMEWSFVSSSKTLTVDMAMEVNRPLTSNANIFHNVGRYTENGNFSYGDGDSATISSGSITKTQSYMILDTEGGAATDDLDLVSGGVSGDVLILRSTTSLREVVIKHGSGALGTFRLKDATDLTLSSPLDVAMFIRVGGVWCQI